MGAKAFVNVLAPGLSSALSIFALRRTLSVRLCSPSGLRDVSERLCTHEKASSIFMKSTTSTSKGVFTLSLDTELAWGTRGDARYLEQYRSTRAVIRSILALCEKYNIRATWAVVGHLFFRTPEEFDRSIYAVAEKIWYPDMKEPELWCGRDIVEKIRACAVPQEIGSHGFTHIMTDEAVCTAEVFRAELAAAQHGAREAGVTLASFVYPQNKVAYLDDLAAAGFTVYRGVDPTWYARLPGVLKKIGHVIDNYLCIPPPSVTPQTEDALVNVPGSYFYPHRDSWAKILPVSFRVCKARTGIRRAIETGRVFHLWFHPFNIASDPDALLAGLEEIFRFVDAERAAGRLENKTMGDFAAENTI